MTFLFFRNYLIPFFSSILFDSAFLFRNSVIELRKRHIFQKNNAPKYRKGGEMLSLVPTGGKHRSREAARDRGIVLAN
jgi:hypothetical protein